MKVRNFASFIFESNAVPSLVTRFDDEIASAQMRIGPTMDKLPWAMDDVVFSYLKDKTIQSNSTHGNVDIESIVKQLEADKESLKSQALEKIQANGTAAVPGADPMAEEEPKPAYKVLKIKDYHITTRPIGSSEGSPAGESEPVDGVEKAFRHSRNRGRNIMRKVLTPETFHKPTQPPVPQAAPAPQPLV